MMKTDNLTRSSKNEARADFLRNRSRFSFAALEWNFRDIGGYPCKYGYVSPGWIFRSSYLANLRPLWIAALQALDINKVIDLREYANRANNADDFEEYGHILGTKIKYVNAPVYTMTEVCLYGFKQSVYGKQGLLNWRAAKTYRKIFSILLHSRRATILQCDSGKDRTGVICALIELLLGVSDKNVVRDYMLTKHFGSKDMKLPQSQIEMFLKLLHRYYGTAYNYFRKHLGCSKQEIKQFRKHYCQKSKPRLSHVYRELNDYSLFKQQRRNSKA